MTKFGLLCTAAVLFSASSAHALNLGVPGFAGYSVFSEPCPLCDSLVNFTVYQNTDGDWTDDPYFSGVSQNGIADSDGQWGNTIDSSAGYVYMYQPVNLDNDNPPDNPLVTFGVTMHTDRLANVTSAGYFGGVFLGEIGQTVDANPHFDVDDIDLVTYVPDVAGDRTPNRANEGTVGLTATATQIVSPTSVFSANLISNGAAGFAPTPGVTFLYGDTIPTNVSSATVFLTSNQRPGYEWAETESIGGTGAVGDVPAPVPVPAGAVLLGSGIAIAGLYRRFKSPNTAV